MYEVGEHHVGHKPVVRVHPHCVVGFHQSAGGNVSGGVVNEP